MSSYFDGDNSETEDNESIKVMKIMKVLVWV